MRRVAGALVALGLAACSHDSKIEPGELHAHKNEPPRTDAGASVAPPTPTTPEAALVTPPVRPAKVKIMVRTTPPKVMVHWGKKNLGPTPLNFERPRDSGPVDLVLRAPGYFPVHTRAYTVKSDTIGVKMVKLADRMTLFGAREELPPDDPVEGAPGSATGPAAPAPLDPASINPPPKL